MVPKWPEPYGKEERASRAWGALTRPAAGSQKTSKPKCTAGSIWAFRLKKRPWRKPTLCRAKG